MADVLWRPLKMNVSMVTVLLSLMEIKVSLTDRLLIHAMTRGTLLFSEKVPLLFIEACRIHVGRRRRSLVRTHADRTFL